MFGETKHCHDGIRAFSITVGYPGWDRESILIHEIQRAKRSIRYLEDCKFSVDYYHGEGDITEECKENLLLNINNYIEANNASADKSAK